MQQERILCPICGAPNRGDARYCQQCGNDVLLDNIYRILKVIKEGGMGKVFKAVDSAGVEYAVKEMHDRFATPAQREEGIEDFVSEAKLLLNLDHTKTTITVHADGKVLIEGTQGVTIDAASSAMELKGGQISLKATSGVTVDGGGGAVSVKSGSQLTLDGGAMATMKAAMVKIN